MSVSGISSSNQYQLNSLYNPYQQAFQQLGQNLKSGNLSAAQSDFSTIQQAFSQSATSSSTSSTSTSSATSNPVSQAFNQLASDLQSGNIASAQKDFSTLQSDLKASGGPGINRFRHHHRISTGGEPAPNSTNLVAQQAYALQAQPPVSIGVTPHPVGPSSLPPSISIGSLGTLINPESLVDSPPLSLVA